MFVCWCSRVVDLNGVSAGKSAVKKNILDCTTIEFYCLFGDVEFDKLE